MGNSKTIQAVLFAGSLLVAALAHAADSSSAEYGFARRDRIWVEKGKSVRADLSEVDAVNTENGKHMRLRVKTADTETQGDWVSTATYTFKGDVDDSAQLVVLFAAPSRVSVHLCASSEGLHVTAWSGAWKKKTSRRLWHAYWHVDMDLEADCTERETN